MNSATVILYIAVSLTASSRPSLLRRFAIVARGVADPTLRTTNWQKSPHRREK